MNGALYLAWRYLAHHRLKSLILLGSITLVFYLPLGLRVVVNHSERELTARAEATPLIVGTKGSPLELVLNGLYFADESPEAIAYGEVEAIRGTGLARPIPLNVRHHAQGDRIVGTSLDYFELPPGRAPTRSRRS